MRPMSSVCRDLSRLLICGAAVAFFAQACAIADDPKLDDPSASQIVDRMAKVYADCKSYRDSGLVRTLFVLPGGKDTVEKPFTTAFVRPDRFRFEYKQKADAGEMRYIIWSNGKEVQTWWDLKPGIEKPMSLDFAVAGATGVSSGSAHTIPALLLPDKVSGSRLTELTELKRATDSTLETVECFRVEGKRDTASITLWIEKNSYVVRRIDQHLKLRKNARIEETTIYEPSIDERITDEMLEFAPNLGRNPAAPGSAKRGNTAKRDKSLSEPTNPPPDIVINRNGLFFDDTPPKLDQPIDLSLDAIRGSWVAFRTPHGSGKDLVAASVLVLILGASNNPSWTLDEQGELVENPDGCAELVLDGYDVGLVTSKLAWGLLPNQKRGWLASPNAPFEKSVEFWLVSPDLLRVKGEINVSGTRLGLDLYLLPVGWRSSKPGSAPNNFAFGDVEDYVALPLEGDLAIESESVTPYVGTWVAKLTKRKVVLKIGDHRVLRTTVYEEGKPEVRWNRLLQFSPGQKAIEIQPQDISSTTTTGPTDDQGRLSPDAVLRLTQSGRLIFESSNPGSGIIFNREQPAGDTVPSK